MAYLGYSEDFELDDDGILRDSMSSGGGILIDDDGILRDSFDTQSKYTAGSTGTHWTDSGLERDKQSAGSSSTLRHSDLHSFPSYDDVSQPLGENANISDLEASKDELSFDRDSMVDGDEDELVSSRPHLSLSKLGDRSLQSSNRSSFDHSLAFESTDPKSGSEKDLFDPEYYKQLQELGVLVDGTEFENKNSLNEFEELEAHVSRDNIELSDEEQGDSEEDIEQFLRRTPTCEQLLGDYMGHRHGERYHDTSRDSRDHDDVVSRTRPSTANSARTIGSEPFPEISPEEALQLYQEQLGYRDQLDIVDNDAESIEFQESQQTPQENDDDEIFIITSRISDQPSPAKIKAYHNDRGAPSISPRSLTPKSNQSSRPTSRVSERGSSRGNTPYREGPSFIHDRSFDDDSRRDGSVTPVSAINTDSRPSTRQGSRSGTPLQRPDSAASQRSAASEHYSTHSKSKRSPTNNLSKARSQESFFEKENELPAAGRKQGEKMPKRLLPKPSEVNTPLKVKSKSTTNISANRTKPMKPKYSSMSMSLVNIDIGEGDEHSEVISASSDKSRTELSSKLHQEFNKRKQATELVQQLQLDYDKLLSKYAQAELTIDQLRLGANVTLHTNSPTPLQASQGALPSPQQPQTIQMGQIGRGVKSPSPFQGSLGVPSPITLTESAALNSYSDQPDGRRNSTRGLSPLLSSGHSQTDPRGNISMDHGAESVKVGLSFQTQNLSERMDSFQAMLDVGEGMSHENQEKIFDQIRNDHEKLRKDYLQVKEDYNTRKRTSGTGDVNFDEDKELEGELFRLGMKFDDIHQKVEENRKEKHSQRQPFQSNRRQSDSDILTSGMSDQEMRSVDQMKHKIRGVKAGNDLIQPKPNKEFEQKIEKLHVEYNALMDRYRRLKQMAQTPERDREIDNLVRKLYEISQQEPDVFKMPHELEDRWQQLERGDNEDDSVFSSRRQSLNSQGSRRPSKEDSGRGSFAKTENKPFTRDPQSSDHTVGSTRSLHTSDLDPHSDSLGRMRDSSMSGSRSSVSSRGRSPRDSTFDRDSPTPRLPRPRRHDHREPRSGNLKKRYFKLMAESGERPEAGSFSSLQDSGISDQEGSRPRERGASGGGGALSNLPGPGTFKQMTKQRHAGDADSGFIGSMVGSEVSGQASARQQQGQGTLRLRQSDSGSDRPRSRSSRSSRADDSSVASSRTGRKQERPPSRESAQSGRRSNNQSRDYTDDSYTLTESEMSFDIPESRPRRSSRDVRSGRRSVDLPIKEEEEERPRSTQSQGSRRSQRVQETPLKTPKKPAKNNVSFSEFSDEELTPRAERSYNESREILSSEDNTPREQPIRPEQRVETQRATVSRREEKARPSTPGAKKEPPRPPTPKIPTPRSDRSGASSRRNQVPPLEISRTRAPEETRRPVVEDRGVGSDSDDTMRGSVATAATKGSDSSEKFKLLQAEIGRLREEFQMAASQNRQTPPQEPPPSQHPPTREDDRDRYFDPTEDPYAFMMGPRRRANSFSGAGARDWNDWWKYPPNQQQDDIPLGYAAADSFNPNSRVPPQVLPEPQRSREKKRIKRKYRNRAAGTEFPDEYDSDQSPSRVTATTATDEQLYSYYVPRYQAARTQTHQQPVRMQRFASQPNLLQNATFQAAPPQPPPQQSVPPPPQYPNVPTTSYAAPISAGYSRLRSSLRNHPTQPVYQAPQYSYDDLDTRGQQPIGYLVTTQPPPPPPVAPPVYLEQTAACPMCGGSGVHSHGEFVYEAPPSEQPVTYVIQSPPRGRPRRRSKSASRVRHYSPDGRNRSRYLIREYISDDSSSAESEDDIIYRRRSRSAGRRSRVRTRQVRKYKKSHEFEDELEMSLNLSEEIGEMTQRMVSRAKSGLALSRRKDFGSSYW
ncbi:serine/arginine repetitive matrix protein 2 isoform X4 [Magallana gigas]|uniref:serine/arginine repetitive matrix protein 2 isoform X4 n=1 Tax=Magallana gigas TaxID=29159 RepID=UPI00333E45E2